MLQNNEAPLYQVIAQQIREQILSGELTPGQSLPPVRQMAQQWNCTPGTVHRAYQLLQDEALIVSRPGYGTVVQAKHALISTESPLAWAALIHQLDGLYLQALHAGFRHDDFIAAAKLVHQRFMTIQSHQSGFAKISGEKITSFVERNGISDNRTTLHFAGSHDLLLDWLLTGDEGEEFQTDYIGSLDGLMAMQQGKADFCGVHLFDETTGTYNTPYIQRLLPDQPIVLITIAHRSLGLIVAPGNPLKISQLADLVRSEIRFANRQPGAGSRVWLEQKLRSNQIDPEKIPGYGDEYPDHYSVAQAVASGKCNVGVGIAAAAASAGMAFIPCAVEPYQLVVPQFLFEHPTIDLLRQKISSDAYHRMSVLLGGYDISLAGELTYLPG